MKLKKEQIEILDHTAHRAANNLFCGESPDMDWLVDRGLMKYVGMTGFCPDKYYRITPLGRAAIAKAKAKGEQS